MSNIILLEVALLQSLVHATAQLSFKTCSLSCNGSATDEP